MRIRSIKPDFWRSDDIANLEWHVRLVYIGLWAYVDDGGVGRDDERLIVSDLFPLDDRTEASERVHGALTELSLSGHIERYEVDGRRYLYIPTFLHHQVINRPSKTRMPLPPSALPDDSVSTHGALTPGEGEGEGDRRRERENGAADAALSPFCPKHPGGTDKPCGPCGTARERYKRASARPTPLPRLADTPMCEQHAGYPLEANGTCARCTREQAETRGAA